VYFVLQQFSSVIAAEVCEMYIIVEFTDTKETAVILSTWLAENGAEAHHTGRQRD